jgi:hypothetical protein
MREVTRFQSPGGSLHESVKACEQHEVAMPKYRTEQGEYEADVFITLIDQDEVERAAADYRAGRFQELDQLIVELKAESARPPQPRGETRHAD